MRGLGEGESRTANPEHRNRGAGGLSCEALGEAGSRATGEYTPMKIFHARMQAIPPLIALNGHHPSPASSRADVIFRLYLKITP
jgi:hypothetical protein